MIFILPERAYAIFISDQYQPWPYLALFSHNTTVTHRRTDGQQTHRACQRLYSIAVARHKEGVCFWGTNFHSTDRIWLDGV